MPTIITPAELAERAAAVRAARESTKATKRGKRAKGTTPSTPTAPAPDVAPEAITPPLTTAPVKGKIVTTLSPEALKAQIDALLSKLRAETNADAKKKIRRALRLRGHRGGLSHERAAATPSPIDDAHANDATADEHRAEMAGEMTGGFTD